MGLFGFFKKTEKEAEKVIHPMRERKHTSVIEVEHYPDLHRLLKANNAFQGGVSGLSKTVAYNTYIIYNPTSTMQFFMHVYTCRELLESPYMAAPDGRNTAQMIHNDEMPKNKSFLLYAFHPCRYSHASVVSNQPTSIENIRHNMESLLNYFEKSVNWPGRSKVNYTNCDQVFSFRLSKEWYRSILNFSLTNLLMRIGGFFYDDTEKALDYAIASSPEIAEKNRYAIMRFLSGCTHYCGPGQSRGWDWHFKDSSKEEIDDLLIPPEKISVVAQRLWDAAGKPKGKYNEFYQKACNDFRLYNSNKTKEENFYGLSRDYIRLRLPGSTDKFIGRNGKVDSKVA